MNTPDRDYDSEAKGDAIFDALSDYEKGELVRWGTSFTTYEDHGDSVCAQLMSRTRAWYVTARAEAQKAAGERLT